MLIPLPAPVSKRPATATATAASRSLHQGRVSKTTTCSSGNSLQSSLFARPCVSCRNYQSPTQLELWRPSLSALERTASNAIRPATAASSYYTTQLSTAFLIGGLFFSIVLPRLISWIAYFLESLRQKQRQITNRSRGKNKNNKHRLERIKFRTVKRQGLVVLQHITSKLIQRSFQTQLRKGFQQALSEVENPNIRIIKLVYFQTCSTPQFHRGRIYDDIDDAMIFDADLTWENAIETQLEVTTKRLGLKIPVILQNIHVKGTARIILTPLQEEPPGFGAILFSFSKIPRLEVDVDIAGRSITQVPWLKQGLIAALQSILEKQMVWPNRIVNAAFKPNLNATLIDPIQLEELETKDPFLQAQSGLLKKRQKGNRRRQLLVAQKNSTQPTTTSKWKQQLSDKVVQPLLNRAAYATNTNITNEQSSAKKKERPKKTDRSWDWNKLVNGVGKRFQPLGKRDTTTAKGKDGTEFETDPKSDQSWEWDKLLEGVFKSFDTENNNSTLDGLEAALSSNESVNVNTNTTETNTNTTTMPIDFEDLQQTLQNKANETMEKLSSADSIDEFFSLLEL